MTNTGGRSMLYENRRWRIDYREEKHNTRESGEWKLDATMPNMDKAKNKCQYYFFNIVHSAPANSSFHKMFRYK